MDREKGLIGSGSLDVDDTSRQAALTLETKDYKERVIIPETKFSLKCCIEKQELKTEITELFFSPISLWIGKLNKRATKIHPAFLFLW